MNLYRGGICVTDGTDACVGGDVLLPEGPRFGGFGGIALVSAVRTFESAARRSGGDDGCIDCFGVPVAGPIQRAGDTAGRDDIYFAGWREKAAKWLTV